MNGDNLYQQLPTDLSAEFFQTLAENNGIRIERIVSNGHCSAPGVWYDQAQNEWVAVLKGEARLRFERDNRLVHLTEGGYVNIPAHEKHRVEWTVENAETIWLAVFY